MAAVGFWFSNSVPDPNLYGTWLFLLTPFIGGMISGSASNLKRTTTGLGSWTVSLVAVFGALFGLTAMMLEGAICLIMAAPLVYFVHVPGYAIGRGLTVMARNRKRPFLVAAFPLSLGILVNTAYQVPEPEVRVQTTTMVVDATPEEIWPMLFTLNDIPDSEFWLFQMGVGHTLGVRSHGQYLGAYRECLLSTGTMPETISIFEENRRLRFKVLKTPPPMNEVNPFGEVHAPHLHGYYSVDWGEIALEPLPNGKTLMTGTSKFEYRLYPAEYWNLWMDLVSDQIHLRVFGEMKTRAEAE